MAWGIDLANIGARAIAPEGGSQDDGNGSSYRRPSRVLADPHHHPGSRTDRGSQRYPQRLGKGNRQYSSYAPEQARMAHDSVHWFGGGGSGWVVAAISFPIAGEVNTAGFEGAAWGRFHSGCSALGDRLIQHVPSRWRGIDADTRQPGRLPRSHKEGAPYAANRRRWQGRSLHPYEAGHRICRSSIQRRIPVAHTNANARSIGCRFPTCGRSLQHGSSGLWTHD